MKKNKSVLLKKIVKNLNEIDFVANLIIELMKTNQEQFLLLKGEIGVGKTTLVKAIAKNLKEKKEVISPTFNKMFVYDNFVHMDAYNLEGQNLDQFQDFFEDKIVIIEWFENLNEKFNEGFEIEIIYLNDNEREYQIKWRS